MTLESCNTVRVTKRWRKMIPGLWTGNGKPLASTKDNTHGMSYCPL